MGFLGGDNEPSHGDELLDQQIEANQAELENKRASLYKTRLDIIKGQGGQTWQPDRNPPSTMQGGKNSNGKGFPFGGEGFLNR